MFALNERVVYAGHGVAKITRIIEKKIASSGTISLFFELSFLSKPMIILVPVGGVDDTNIRRLSSRTKLEEALCVLSEPSQVVISEQIQVNWNKKNKKIQEEIRSGDLRAICVLYRDLSYVLSLKKGLSYGEQELLKKTEGLLVEEISLVCDMEHDEAFAFLRSYMTASDRSAAQKTDKKVVITPIR